MMTDEKHVTLRNGVVMPILGLGTSGNPQPVNYDTTLHAIRHCGYRLIDTAQVYGSEQHVGEAVRESSVPREEMFLTSKLGWRYYELQTAERETKSSLEKLNTDYFDLFLLHWPGAKSDEELFEAWRFMELLLEKEETRAIGVSNFLPRHLDKLLDNSCVVPFVNQCEFHIYQNDKELRNYCAENKIRFDGWSPLGKGKQVLDDPFVKEISKYHNKTPAQVLVRWSIQNDVVTIPKSTKKHRVEENCLVWDFLLSEKEMDTLNNLHQNLRLGICDPSNVP